MAGRLPKGAVGVIELLCVLIMVATVPSYVLAPYTPTPRVHWTVESNAAPNCTLLPSLSA